MVEQSESREQNDGNAARGTSGAGRRAAKMNGRFRRKRLKIWRKDFVANKSDQDRTQKNKSEKIYTMG